MCEIEKEFHKYRGLSFSILEWLETMVLNDRILLQDIPQSIRLADGSALYTYALRLSSRKDLPCERFVCDLNTLREDILSLDDNSREIIDLVDRLFSYLSINEHEGEESFINFKNNLNERVRTLIKRRGGNL